MFASGQIFGKYTILKPLGQGGMGAVYLIRHNLLDSQFALKILSAQTAEKDHAFVQRFIREAKLASQIRHPNLVAVHDAGRDEETGRYYLIMDYMTGGTLRDRLERAHGPLPLSEALAIVCDIASALEAAARHGMVHRDIKPENIMFDGEGHAHLADLGLAKATSAADSLVTMPDAVFGTPSYMAPEQVSAAGQADARADIYSLGIVFFEMLAGKRPIEGKTTLNVIAQVVSPERIPDIRTVAAKVPEAVAKLIAEMCAKKAAQRPASAAILSRRLQALSVPFAVRKPRKGLRWAFLVAGLLLVALGAGGYLAYRTLEEAHRREQAEVQRRLAEEQAREAEAKRAAEAKRLAAEKAREDEAKRAAEAKRLAAEKAREDEAKRAAEAKRLAAEKAREAEAKRAAEAKRLAAEQAREAEAKRAAEAKRLAEEQAREDEAKRAAEAKRLAEEKAKRTVQEVPKETVRETMRWYVTIQCDTEQDVAKLRTVLAAQDKPFGFTSFQSAVEKKDFWGNVSSVRVTGVLTLVSEDGHVPAARKILSDYLNRSCTSETVPDWGDFRRLRIEQDFSTVVNGKKN